MICPEFDRFAHGRYYSWIDHRKRLRLLSNCCVAVFAVALYLVCSAMPASATDPLGNWHWRNPLPQGSTLSDVVNGDGLFVAVGEGGTILTSTDGDVWTASVSGTAMNLNAITYANGTFIAVGAKGVMLASADGVNWTFRNANTSQDLYSIAYESGIFISGSTSIVIISEDGFTWAAQSTGTIWPVTDIAYGNGVFVGVTYENIVITSSDGKNWTIRNTPECWEFMGVTFGSDLFVAVGFGGTILTSPDGASWVARSSGTDKVLSDIIHANGKYIAVGDEGIIVKSSDGVNWSALASVTENRLAGLAFGNETYVAAGFAGTVLTSLNGESWTNHSSGFSGYLYDIVYNNGQLVAVGGNGAILYSPDGISWTQRNSGATAFINKIAYGGGRYVAVGGSSVILSSADGLSWTIQETPVLGATLYGVAYGNGKFVVVGGGYENGSSYCAVLASSDGTAWTRQFIGTTDSLKGIVFADDIFVAVGNKGLIVTSEDGATWTSRTSSTTAWLSTVSYGNGKFVALGQSVLLTSANGVSWTSNTFADYISSGSIKFMNGSFILTGSYGKLYSSIDGVSWETRYVGSNNNLYGITYDSENYYVVGATGLIKSGASLLQLPILHKLTVEKSGSGTGAIGSNSADINCGSVCSATLPSDTEITLVATPDATSDFVGWTGACDGSSLFTCSVTMDAAKNITATFSPQIGLEEIRYDDNGIDLSASPWSNSPGSEIAVRFTPQTYPVALKAVKFFVPLYRDTKTLFEVRIYAGNNGNYPGTRLNKNAITAAATNGNEWVTVDVSKENIQIAEGDFFVGMYWLTAPSSTGQYAQYLGIDKTAPVAERTCWKGGASGIWLYWPPDDIAYGNAMIRAITATPAGLPLLTVINSGSGMGTVTSAPAGINCGSDCFNNFDPDTTVNLSAMANPGSSFAGWSGGGCSGIDSCTVSMSASKTINALFEKKVFTITAKEGINGIIAPFGKVTVPYGADQTFTFTPNGNCQIADILVDDISVGIRTTYTFNNVQESHTIRAVFAGDKQLRGVTVAGTQTDMTIGSTQSLLAVASYSDESTGIISNPIWTSLKPSVAGVASDGSVEAISEGTTSIIAIYQGLLGKLDITVGASVPTETQQYGNLVIVAGGGVASSNTLKEATQNLCDQVYRVFKTRGFRDDDIYYFNPMTWHDIDGDGMADSIIDDSTLSLEKFGQSITQWAAGRNTNGPLYIYLNDHGEIGTFLIAPPDIYLRASQMKTTLDTFQQQTGRKVIVIIEACYSGSFASALISTSYDRIVVTSTAANDLSFMGSNGNISFTQFLMQSLWEGNDLHQAQLKAKQYLLKAGSPMNLMQPQLSESTPLSSSQVKVGGDFVIAGLFPEFLEQSPPAVIAKGSSHLFSVKLASLNGIESVWAVVLPPGFEAPQSNGYFDSPDVNYPVFNLVDFDNDGIFVGGFDQFISVGDYRVTYYARNRTKNISISLPTQISVMEEISVILGDIDGNGIVDLSDAILSAQMVIGIGVIDRNIYPEAEVNNDGKIGVAEIAFILQSLVGVRE